MFPKITKILKLSANDLDTINNYLKQGAVVLSCNTVQTGENSSETSYFFIGLLNSSN